MEIKLLGRHRGGDSDNAESVEPHADLPGILFAIFVKGLLLLFRSKHKDW